MPLGVVAQGKHPAGITRRGTTAAAPTAVPGAVDADRDGAVVRPGAMVVVVEEPDKGSPWRAAVEVVELAEEAAASEHAAEPTADEGDAVEAGQVRR